MRWRLCIATALVSTESGGNAKTPPHSKVGAHGALGAEITASGILTVRGTLVKIN